MNCVMLFVSRLLARVARAKASIEYKHPVVIRWSHQDHPRAFIEL